MKNIFKFSCNSVTLVIVFKYINIKEGDWVAIKESNKRLFITIDKELLKLIEVKAKEDDRSISNYISRVLKNEINRK